MKNPHYTLQPDGSFVMEHYQSAKPFASFLPGIAGKTGKPMWVFYSNRGQAVTSFGIRDKDGAMMEFHPANKAHTLVHTHGFRTFLKLDGQFHEPFRMGHAEASQRMTVRPQEIVLGESLPYKNLECEVVYFTLPHSDTPALLRSLTLVNTGDRPRQVELLDGMPFVVPAFVKNASIKDVANTKCGTTETLGLENSLLFCRSRVKSSDAVHMEMVEAGNFHLAFDASGERLPLLAEPALLFGEGGDFSRPFLFADHADFLLPKHQRQVNFMPCAFAYKSTLLPPGGRLTVFSAFGQAAHLREAEALGRTLAAALPWETLRSENTLLIERLLDRALTVTAHPVFDQYCRQSLLDNVLRGGLPFSFAGKCLHLYFRKHGDTERDYNAFSLQPAHFSQGNGNYRDILQNRRTDNHLLPEVGDANIRVFLNAIQPDGNNPLVYEGTRFSFGPDLATMPVPMAREAAGKFGTKPFTAGALSEWVHASCRSDPMTVTAGLLAHASQHETFKAAPEGYWSDHWTYCLDLIENFAALHPEKLEALLFEDCSFSYFENQQHVLPHGQRFVWEESFGEVRQLDSLEVSKERLARLNGRTLAHDRNDRPHLVLLFEKLFCLTLVKLASLDPDGIGIEMQGNRPGWNDAMNGLPGLLGSSTCETAELLRLVQALLRMLESRREPILLSRELAVFRDSLLASCAKRVPARERYGLFQEALDAYRCSVLSGFSGERESLSPESLKTFLSEAAATLHQALALAQDPETGLYATYFYYKVTAHQPHLDSQGNPVLTKGRPAVLPTALERQTLPPFLEGQMRVLRVLEGAEARRRLYQAVRQSSLYDAKLGMYRLNASLARQPQKIGRAGIFPPGWLENESIWMHMAYKYLLETLRSGLIEAFYEDARTGLVPFMKPEIYGRSPCEHSSFIVSSAHPDATLHGAGFYARLSGATVELLSIRQHLLGIQELFVQSPEGQLTLNLTPCLPANWFTQMPIARTWQTPSGPRTIEIPENAVAFSLFEDTLVILRNPQRRHGYGKDAVRPTAFTLRYKTGRSFTLPQVTGEHALALRAGKIETLEAILG